jgi:NhaP-type Na+/H+ or K+/H+ antiporter
MIVTVLYYLLTGFIAALVIWNLIKSKKWQDEILYIIILIPFLLRLFRLK